MTYYRSIFPRATSHDIKVIIYSLFFVLFMVALSGCALFGDAANMSGMLKVDSDDPNGCMIFQGNGRYDGRVSESHIDGSIYVRKGTCNTQDQAKAK